MSGKSINMERYALNFSRTACPYRVFATWNIHYACNYQCSYCHAPKPEHKDARKASYLTSDIWLEIWERIYNRYGTWEMLISGGEPFIYPGFMELLIRLSKMHIVSVCTNLDWDVAYFVKNVSSERIKIDTSFHPEFADLNEFIEKIKLLKGHGFNPTVNFVPWPPLLEKMEAIKEAVDTSGCQLTLQPFNGRFDNRSYPQGYTEQEKAYFKIFKDNCNLNTLDFKTTAEAASTKGKLCRMGQNYVFIHPDGGVSRCCKDHTLSLGNIIDGSFRLLDEPAVCMAETCNCWRCMLVGQEDFWMRHWGRPEISKKVMEEHGIKRDNAYRVSLVQPPVWGIYDPSVALAQISSCLKKDSCEVSVFDLNIEFYQRRRAEFDTVWAIEQSSFWTSGDNVRDFFKNHAEVVDECVNKIVSARPNLVGFSVNVCALPAALELAKMIKQRLPDVKVALGGPMFFINYDAAGILEHDCIDIIVGGEGEETFCELARFLFDRKDLAYCKGIWFKKAGKAVKTEERRYIKNLDELPFLDLESFPRDKYILPGHLGNHISLMTSRGCILNCVYCGPKAYWRGFRFMSGRRIYDEVKYHLRKNSDIEHIEFLDLEINGNIHALSEFCDLMIGCPPKAGITWHANMVIRPEMSRELLFKMQQAGCRHLSVGIETGSQRLLEVMRKQYSIKDAQDVLKYAHDAGIHITTNFMFGFPGETEDDFNLTLEFLRRNAGLLGTVYPSRTFFTIEPFSYLSGHMEEFGVIADQNYKIYWESTDGRNNYLERLRRCEEFSKLALQLGVSIGLGLQTSLDLDRYYNLGYYYEYKKDFKKARFYFEEYLKLDPKNAVINKKISVLRENDIAAERIIAQEKTVSPGRQSGDGQIVFNWNITAVCDYRCPYCWFYAEWAAIKKRNIDIPASKLKAFWGRVNNKYGQIRILISGGEPFLYPNFIDLLTAVSDWHKVEVVTNLSWPVKSFVEFLNPATVVINPSFHPLFSDFEEFVSKLLLLRKRGLTKDPSYVAWPPQIPVIKYYAQKFQGYGIEMRVQPFLGEYKGLKYPEGYMDSEKKTMMPYLEERQDRVFRKAAYPVKEKLCYAGCRYGLIHPDGAVLRCSGLHYNDAKIGSIFYDDFELYPDAKPCASEECSCDEREFLLKESLPEED